MSSFDDEDNTCGVSSRHSILIFSLGGVSYKSLDLCFDDDLEGGDICLLRNDAEGEYWVRKGSIVAFLDLDLMMIGVSSCDELMLF
jgi:hypothetical protein